ncbi:hypothetical protein KXX33_003234 [Aspergillus fumigatus]|nr:hypothetical protein KXX45_006837 [Aspergillus fumigatus]KAH1362831.1 hypothetical protein KXX33_003234 [Aspergillus fumigatus]KAH1470425.1 hypothetical protein KXX53_000296 [Aspergillus fumigatus]KAH1537412.1 hypothetical protein KXX61_009449 [Aspergillus fumigatus]KAH1552507.1 hypothetical protein KXX37_009405 [Aspergillus fumigatus]
MGDWGDAEVDIATVVESDENENAWISRQANLWQELENYQRQPPAIVLLYANYPEGSIDDSPVLRQKNPNVFFPPEFFPVIRADLNGTFFCNYDIDGDGNVTKHISWACFKIKHVVKPGLYTWIQTAVFVQWHPQANRQLVFFLNLPDVMAQYLAVHRPSPAQRGNPFIWHTLFAQGVVEEYDSSIWSLRHLVRPIEKARNAPKPPELNFPNLHDIARHIFHANETLAVATHTLQSLIDEQARFRAEHPALTGENKGSWIHTAQRAHFVAKQLHSLLTRSQSLSERLRNEINLAFNLVSQKDGAMMKTVAIVSMVYLPGTFISGLFGTNFFDLSNDGGAKSWIMSGNFWLYWVITVPLTLATVLVWASWHYFPHYYPRISLKPLKGADSVA